MELLTLAAFTGASSAALNSVVVAGCRVWPNSSRRSGTSGMLAEMLPQPGLWGATECNHRLRGPAVAGPRPQRRQ